jgi:hypothetical protein
MAQCVVCRHCGAHNPHGASWCEKCNRSLEGASPVRADPDVTDGRQLLLTLVREQRELIHGQKRQIGSSPLIPQLFKLRCCYCPANVVP